MSRPVRIITGLVVVAVVLAAVAGIAWWTAQNEPVVETGLYVDGQKVENPPAMLTIGGNEVSFDVYRHYFLMYKGYFEDYYGAGFYDEDPDGDRVYTLKKMVEVELKNMYTWIAIGKENGVELDDADREKIEATLNEQKESFGAAFPDQLSEMFYLSEENYRQVAELQALAEKSRTAYQEKLGEENSKELAEEIDAKFLEESLRAKHILIKIDTEAEDAEAAKQEALEKAESILAEIQAGGSTEAAFDAAMNQYSEDPGLAENPNGYVFQKGQMVEVFYQTTLELEEGAISEPVLSESGNYSGYHIIMRLPLTDEDVAANRTTAIGSEVSQLLEEKAAEVEKSLQVTYPDFYERLTVKDIL